MATIMCLPDQVIDIILGYDDISIEDIINFRCVSDQFRLETKYYKVWEKKVFQRWPSATKLYDKQFKENEQKNSEENKQNNEKSLNFMKTGINCGIQLRNYVSQIIEKYYNDNKSIDNLTKYVYVFRSDKNLRNNLREILYEAENFIKYSFFIDELKNLLTPSPQRTGRDLTEEYCKLKLFHYMRQCSVQKKWDRFEEQPRRQQLLERVATFVAQLIQPEKDVFYACVKTSLDNIALEVLNFLREKHPHHSIFSTSAETFSYWENNNIDDNHWKEAEGTQIMDTLVEYIFGKLNFRPSNLRDTNLEYICIDNVLKNKYGHEMLLATIYHSVARRLGLRCNVVRLRFNQYRTYNCIFWKPTYATNSLKDVRCFNIESEKFPNCLVSRLFLYRTLYSVEPYRMTAKRMLHEMIKIVAGLTYDYNNTFSNLPESGYDRRKYKLSLCFNKGAHVIRRSEDVKFAVGMIVKHRNQSAYTPSCAGVIIGWHRHIDRHVEFSIENEYNLFFTFMDIRFLPLNHCRNFGFKKQQTNYIILTEKNKMCYVEEDAITLTKPKCIDNSEIGRYFCEFAGMHYVPNKMLARLYPQDTAITRYHLKNELYKNGMQYLEFTKLSQNIIL